MEDVASKEVTQVIQDFVQPYVDTIDFKMLNIAPVGNDRYRVDCYIYVKAPKEYYLDKVYGIGRSWYLYVKDDLVLDKTVPAEEDISFKGIADIDRGY